MQRKFHMAKAATTFLLLSGLLLAPCAIRAAQQPDLVVQDITWTPAAPLTGQEITFSIVLANRGTQTAPPCTLSFQTGTQVKNIAIPGLHPNARNYVLTQKRRFSTDFNFVVKATIDVRNRVAESNENNNVLQKTLAVNPSTDFVVNDITWTPTSPTTTDRVELRAVVVNQGPGTSLPAYGHFQFGTAVIKCDIPPLAPGQSLTIVRNQVFTQPFHYVIKFTADPDDKVCEVRENNNVLEKTLAATQAPKPDLTIRNMKLNPAAPKVLQPAMLTAEVRNLGPGAALPCKLLLQQGSESKTVSIPALDVNGVYSLRERLIFAGPALQPVLVKLTVDSRHNLAEKNEDNNVAQKTVMVAQ